MRYRDAAAFRQALEQRLKDRAHGDGARLARDRKHVVFDRLLARLVAAAPERWMLKGGFALDLRLAGRARATKDVDIDWRASEDELLESLIEACNEDLDDFFTFAIERTGAPEDRLGGSHRFRISVSLAERPFETFLLDVGFQRGDTIATETLTTGDLLAFADIAPVEVRAIPLELQIAEKLHAYTRTYEGGHPSSRAKDLIDLALLAELARLDAGDLRTAIDSTFARRDTHPEPRTLPAPPGEWAPQVRELAHAVGIASELAAVHAEAASLLEPVLRDEVATGVWDPDLKRWILRE